MRTIDARMVPLSERSSRSLAAVLTVFSLTWFRGCATSPRAARGPHVFLYLADDRARWLTEAERDTIALAIRAELT